MCAIVQKRRPAIAIIQSRCSSLYMDSLSMEHLTAR